MNYYFAYGSNLHHLQMKRRCPNCRFIKKIILYNYSLSFRSKYGAADIEKKIGGKVYGALYLISKAAEKRLDVYEEYPTLYKKMFFRYCDKSGEISNQFPTNPNGSDYNLAAIANPAGNVLAMMPHPERTNLGDKLFSSMREFIAQGNPKINNKLSYVPDNNSIDHYKPGNKASEWVIDMVITDNEAATVERALQKMGLEVTVSRQQHWEITTSGNSKNTLNKIESTGELFNSNKEYISTITKEKNTATLLVRQKEDMLSLAKFESIRERFNINELVKLKRGVVWNISIKNTNFESVLNTIIDTNIFFNPLSHECFRIS